MARATAKLSNMVSLLPLWYHSELILFGSIVDVQFWRVTHGQLGLKLRVRNKLNPVLLPKMKRRIEEMERRHSNGKCKTHTVIMPIYSVVSWGRICHLSVIIKDMQVPERHR